MVPWLPNGLEIEPGIAIGRLERDMGNAQIYRLTLSKEKVLVADNKRIQSWAKQGLLHQDAWKDVPGFEDQFKYLLSGRGLLDQVGSGHFPEDLNEALAFASAMKQTRAKMPQGSLSEAIFLERYTILLPVSDIAEPAADTELLGQYLSGGVRISITSVRRLIALSPGLTEADIARVAIAAGIESGVKGSTTHSQDRDAIPASTSTPTEFKLIGRPSLEKFFNEQVIDIVKQPDRYAKMGIGFPAPIILYGPPGCGKTFAVEKLVENLDWPAYAIDAGSIGSPYIHQTSKLIADAFERAAGNAPAVIVVDEIDAFLSARDGAGASGQYHVEEVSEFLRLIPKASERKILLIGMTNRLESLDPAILRKGRFDHVIAVEMATEAEVTALVDSLFKSLPLDQGIELGSIAKRLSGRPLSDVAYLAREAGRIAVRTGKDFIGQSEIDAALQSLPSGEQKKARSIGFIWQ